MKPIRLGNDINIIWEILSRNGMTYSLEDKSLQLWLISGPFKSELSSFSVYDMNKIMFSIDAEDLTRLGVYKLLLRIKDSEAIADDAAYDLTQMFQLVSQFYPNPTENAVDGAVDLTFTSILNNVYVSSLRGYSAYEIAVNNGYEGTEEDWLESLHADAADRSYDSENPDGLGYVTLKKSKTFTEQADAENTIYEIRYDYDLDGETVEIPAGCVLKFNGGSISNGIINSDDIQIDAGNDKIFDNIQFTGNCVDNIVVKLEWFVDIYLTAFNANSTLCAASQIEQALNCGAATVSVGYGRYYPLQRTITYTGTVDIIAENIARVHRSEARGDVRSNGTYLKNYYEPCIYSAAVVTLFDYTYYKGTGTYTNPLSKRHGLTIEGLSLRCIKSYSDLTDVDVPVMKITSQSEFTQLNFDCVISATDRYITVNTEGTGYYISTATTSGAYIPNYTGLELATTDGYMTFMNIGGYFYGLFNAIRLSQGSSSAWMTSLIIDADIWCVRGLVGTSVRPVIARGHMQPVPGFVTNNGEAFLHGKVVFVQGFVWDLGVSSNGIARCDYAAKIDSDNSTPGNYLSIQQPSTAIWDRYIGLRQDHWSYPNILNGLQSSTYRHSVFKDNDGHVNYLVSTDGENFVDILSAPCFSNVYNQQNLFGLPSFFHEYTSRGLMGGEHPYAYINTATESEYIYFKVEMRGHGGNLSSSAQGKRILVKFDSSWHRNAHIKIVDTSNSVATVDEDIALVPIYKNFYYQLYNITPSYFNVEITWRVRATINSTYGYFRLKDETGVVYVSGLTSTQRAYGDENDRSYATLNLSRGDEVTIRCYKGSNGAVYAWYASGAESDESIIRATVEEFIAAPVSDSQVYELTGNIIGYWTSSDAVDPLPTIYIPNVHSQYYGYYSTNVLPNHPTNSFGYNGEQVYLTTYKRPYYRRGIDYFDSDGFTPARKKGAAADRPVFSATDTDAIGYQYFDTTLGKWIYWDGTAWLYMDGSAV